MQNRIKVIFLFTLISVRLAGQSSDVIRQYIDTYKDLAIREMQRSGVPAAVKLAQGIHETMAGTSDLVLSSNNHFGIKCKSDWKGESVRHDDDLRQECFRKYPSAEDSYRDHSNFLKVSPRYAFLFHLDPTDYKGWAYGLKRAGYATNPKYPQIIIKLIEDYNLEDYTLVALGKKEDPLIHDVHSTSDENDGIQGPVETPPQALPPVNQPVPQSAAASRAGAIKPKAETPARTAERIQENVPVKNEPVPVLVQEQQQPVAAKSAYPEGQFRINETPVVYMKKGMGYISVATQYNVPLARIFEFNDLKEAEFAEKDQLIYLQRKRKTGDHETHQVKPGESLHDIAQSEAIRLETLLEYNLISADQRPAVGEVLQLRTKADHAPVLMLKENYAWNTPVTQAGRAPELIVYTVLPKETIYAISKRFQVQIADIMKWNNLPGYDLKSGQQLKIYK